MTIKRRDLLTASGALALGAALGLLPGGAAAHEYEVGKLVVEHPWLRAPKDGEKNAQFFTFIHNHGDTADRLIAVKCEKFGATEIHGDPKNLTLVAPVIVPPKSDVTLAPGAIHVDLLGLKKHLEVGWGLEIVLVFEKAGEVTIDAAIDAPDAAHAHDAEAMERWQKAHGADTSGPKTGGHDHDHHDHHDHDHHDHQHGDADKK